jgi:hypothetical protein
MTGVLRSWERRTLGAPHPGSAGPWERRTLGAPDPSPAAGEEPHWGATVPGISRRVDFGRAMWYV